MTTTKGAVDERKYLTDAYRQAAFDLLYAARKLREATLLLSHTKVRVCEAAITDLTEARSILADLPVAAAVARKEKA
jgi:hypothetical protein